MEREKSRFDHLVDQHDKIKDFKIDKSLDILRNYHSREGRIGDATLSTESHHIDFKSFFEKIKMKAEINNDDINASAYIYGLLSNDVQSSISTSIKESSDLNQKLINDLNRLIDNKKSDGIYFYKNATIFKELKKETKILLGEYESHEVLKKNLKENLKKTLEECKTNFDDKIVKEFLLINKEFTNKHELLPFKTSENYQGTILDVSSRLNTYMGKDSLTDECDVIKNLIEKLNEGFSNNADAELSDYYIPRINRMILEDIFPGIIARKLKFRLTEEEEIGRPRLNLSSTNICTYALSQYIELWRDNDIKYESHFGSLKEYYIYIVDGLDNFLREDRNSQSLESTDEFSLLNILSFLKLILFEIQKTDVDWSYRNEMITKIFNLIFHQYADNKLSFQENTHPFIYYTFLCAIRDWQNEILTQNLNLNAEDAWKTPDYFEKIAKEIYNFGKYEMYRQIALEKANDGSLFDVKRLIYSLLIVAKDNWYSNDKIRKNVLDLIFSKQLETGLWPIGNVVSTDFVLERGIIKPKRSRIISTSPILSSIECLNDMLMHEDVAKDLKEYNDRLHMTYQWIAKRLREKDSDYLIYASDIKDPSNLLNNLKKSKNASGYIWNMLSIEEQNFLNKFPLSYHPEVDEKLRRILAEKLNRLLLGKELLYHNSLKNLKLSSRTKSLLDKDPKPKAEKLLRLNRLLLDDYFPQDITRSLCVDGKFDRPLGWYPEYEGTHIPKSWVAGHTLVFLKKYCELISELIEENAADYLQAKKYEDLDISWDGLSDSYGMKKFLSYMTNIDEPRVSNPGYRSAFIFGPPGTGKSTIAKALAKKLKWNYVEVTPGQFLEEGELNIIKKANSLFKRLKRLKNTVIFFDEVDQFVELRKDSSGNDGANSSTKWIVTALLPQFQELRKQKDIKFIMATNHITKVDPAMRRSGRIDFVLPMGPICWKDRLKLLRNTLSDICKEIDGNDIKKEIVKAFGDLFLDQDNLIDVDRIDKLQKKEINSCQIINFLARTDCMLYDDMKDLLRSVKNKYRKNQAKNVDDRLYSIFFEIRDLKESEGYKSYANRDLERYQYIDLQIEMKLIQIPPTIKQEIDQEFGIDEKLYCNSFGFPLLCAEDIIKPLELINKIKSDLNNLSNDESYSYIRDRFNQLISEIEDVNQNDERYVKITLRDELNGMIMQELNQIEKYEDLQSLLNTSIFKNEQLHADRNLKNDSSIRHYTQDLDYLLRKLKSYKRVELSNENKLQLINLVWGLNRLVLEKLYSGYIAPSFVFGAHPYTP